MASVYGDNSGRPPSNDHVSDSSSDCEMSLSDSIRATAGYKEPQSSTISIEPIENSIIPPAQTNSSFLNTWLLQPTGTSPSQAGRAASPNTESLLSLDFNPSRDLFSLTPSLIPGTDSSIINALNESFTDADGKIYSQEILTEAEAMIKKRKLIVSPNSSRNSGEREDISSSSEPEISVTSRHKKGRTEKEDKANETISGIPSSVSSVQTAKAAKPNNTDNFVWYEPPNPVTTEMEQDPVSDLNGQTEKNPIIIIEPEKDHREISKFFANEVALVKGLTASKFGSCQIVDTHKNLSKGQLIVELKMNEITTIEDILSVGKIGDWTVKCKLPLAQTVTHGVIGPIGVETPDEKILESLKEKYDQVIEATRLTKGKEKTPTLCIKVTFIGKTLPDKVNLFYQVFKVKLYVDKPWQCFNCQGYGHNATECRFKTRCLLCSGQHRMKDCPNNGNQVAKKCTNCKGDHLACYGGCPHMKLAKKVEHIKATQKLSYRDALRVVRVKEKSSVTPTNAASQVNPSNINYQIENRLMVEQTVSVSTQTDAQILTENISKVNNQMPSLLAQMAILVVELLKIGKESPERLNYSSALEVAHRISSMKTSPDVEEVIENSQPFTLKTHAANVNVQSSPDDEILAVNVGKTRTSSCERPQATSVRNPQQLPSQKAWTQVNTNRKNVPKKPSPSQLTQMKKKINIGTSDKVVNGAGPGTNRSKHK